MTNVKKGLIEIDFSDKIVNIKYTTYISILTDTILFLILLFIGLFLKKIILLLSAMILIQMIYRLISSKSRNNDFLKEMIDKIRTA